MIEGWQYYPESPVWDDGLDLSDDERDDLRDVEGEKLSDTERDEKLNNQ